VIHPWLTQSLLAFNLPDRPLHNVDRTRCSFSLGKPDLEHSLHWPIHTTQVTKFFQCKVRVLSQQMVHDPFGNVKRGEVHENAKLCGMLPPVRALFPVSFGNFASLRKLSQPQNHLSAYKDGKLPSSIIVIVVIILSNENIQCAPLWYESTVWNRRPEAGAVRN